MSDRIRRKLQRFDLGELQIRSKATGRVHNRRESLIDALISESQIDVLRALKERVISIEALDHYAREHKNLGGAGLLAQVKLNESLFTAMETTVLVMGKSANTQKRYDVTRKAFEVMVRNAIGAEAVVRDLERLPWEEWHRTWTKSAADWMHIRRFISRFLSLYLGSKHHPVRYEIIEMIPTKAEHDREIDITVDEFLLLVEKSRDDVKAAWWTLLLTGMRVGEYLACDESAKLANSHQVKVPGTKTAGSVGAVNVAPSLWHWIEAGIPAPLQYKSLRLEFKKAALAIGRPELVLHDLRHAHGQWAVDAGIPEARVQSSLRHKNPAMTRRYTKRQGRGEVAAGLESHVQRKEA